MQKVFINQNILIVKKWKLFILEKKRKNKSKENSEKKKENVILKVILKFEKTYKIVS